MSYQRIWDAEEVARLIGDIGCAWLTSLCLIEEAVELRDDALALGAHADQANNRARRLCNRTAGLAVHSD